MRLLDLAAQPRVLNGGRRELIDALVQGVAGVALDLEEGEARKEGDDAAKLTDQRFVLLHLPALRDGPDGVCRVCVEVNSCGGVGDALKGAQDRGQLGDVVGAVAEVFAPA